MNNKQFDKYILFIRYHLNLSSDMRYTIRLKVLPKKDAESFINFIGKWVALSKKNKTYVNIWKIHGNTLYKVAYIYLGHLCSI